MIEIIEKEKIQKSEDFQVYLSNFAIGKNTFAEHLEESDKELALIYYLRNRKKNQIPKIVRIIDLKMSKLSSILKKKKLSKEDREKIIYEEFNKSLALYDFTNEDYLDHVLNNL